MMAQVDPGHVEMVAGKRASFRVHYRRNGKLYWDAMWAPGTDEAQAKFERCAKEIGWKVAVIRVERIDPA